MPWRRELRRELTLLVGLKVLALALLWGLFFSSAHRVTVDADQASRRLGLAYPVHPHTPGGAAFATAPAVSNAAASASGAVSKGRADD
jgi:hypothetical protein